jgi:hypothetical protein
MEIQGYNPEEAARFTAPKVTVSKETPVSTEVEQVQMSENNPSATETPVESAPDAVQAAAPEFLPIPAGSLKEQLRKVGVPENVQRALNARTDKLNGLQEIPTRITPELLMSLPGRGEWAVTKGLNDLKRYGIRAKTPDQNDPVNAIGLDHARNDRLRKQGIGTFGQLLQVWGNPEQRNQLDPGDVALIEHRLHHLGLFNNTIQ